MITVDELRIGNNVMCKISNDSRIYKVLGIPAWGYNGLGDGVEAVVLIDRCPKELVPVSKLKPIKLTKELLELFGFKPSSETSYGGWISPEFDGQAIRIRQNAAGNFYFLLDKYASPLYIFNVHQLQNFFYALSGGNELEINNTVNE